MALLIFLMFFAIPVLLALFMLIAKSNAHNGKSTEDREESADGGD